MLEIEFGGQNKIVGIPQHMQGSMPAFRLLEEGHSLPPSNPDEHPRIDQAAAGSSAEECGCVQAGAAEENNVGIPGEKAGN